MYSNTTGSSNTAIGVLALDSNTTGNNNIALGYLAGVNLTNGHNNIHIGNQGFKGESATIRMGEQGTQNATFVAGISGATVADGVPVVVDGNGQLGVAPTESPFSANQLLEQRRVVRELEATIVQQQKQIEALTAACKK